MRKTVQVSCDFCGKTIDKIEVYLKYVKNKFCNNSCSAEFKKIGVEQNCFNCGISVYVTPGRLRTKTRKTNRIFCSKSCSIICRNSQVNGEDHPNWTGGYGSYRQRALKEYNEDCQNPWCELRSKNIKIYKQFLDVDHIDNDRSNNKIENLQLLCVLCHTRKTRNFFEYLD